MELVRFTWLLQGLVSVIKKKKMISNARYRKWQVLVSATGAVLIVPWGMFLGAMFTFSFRPNESSWAYGFDIVTFWSQVAAILFSFLKPRIAAVWMLSSVGVSLLIGIGFEIQSAFSPDASHLNANQWIAVLPKIAKTCVIFWGLPTIFALLLLRVPSSGQPTEKVSEML